MTLRYEIDKVDADTWDDFVTSSPKGHALQTSAWGELKASFGWRSARVTVHESADVLAGAQVLFRPLPALARVWPSYVAYVPKGPVLDYADSSCLNTLLAGLDRLCRQRRAILLKLEPDEPESDILHQRLASAGFQRSRHTVQPHSTVVVDLSPDPDTILARMSAKNRYNIRLADKKGVTIQVGCEGDIPGFYDLALITSRRDGFAIHHLDYYRQVYRLFSKRDCVRLFLALYDGKLLAGLMAFAVGSKSWYLYGASSNEERHRMPNYALQWETMTWAKSKGCLTYDLWGIPDDIPALEAHQAPELKTAIDHPPPGTLWGVYRFKRGFGGQIVQYIGAYDRIFSLWLYRLYDPLVSRRGAAAT